jgi:divalent metal cation (Fe/Co/Zn/Cd) transporter
MSAATKLRFSNDMVIFFHMLPSGVVDECIETSLLSKINTENLYTTIHKDDDEADESALAKFASIASWIVNWFLFGVKFFIVIASASKAVAAALADSAVDLVSQGDA